MYKLEAVAHTAAAENDDTWDAFGWPPSCRLLSALPGIKYRQQHSSIYLVHIKNTSLDGIARIVGV